MLRAFRKTPFFVCMSVLAALSPARGADVFFSAGFDGPVTMGGWVEAFSPKPRGLLPGRVGNACAFAPTTRNLLRPSQAHGEIFSPSGLVRIADIRCNVQLRYRDTFHDAAVASALVKGDPADTLELSVTMIAPNENDRTPAGFNRFEPHPQKIALTGGWQRVAAYAFSDPRLNNRHRAYTMTFRSALGKPLSVKECLFELKYTGKNDKPFVAPGLYTAPGETTPFVPFYRRLRDFDAGFPVKEGSFVAWVRRASADNLTPRLLSFFQCADWMCSPQLTTVAGVPGRMKPAFTGDDDRWHHVAVTWSATNAAVYADGRKIDSRRRNKTVVFRREDAEFKMGGWGVVGRNPSGVALDEVAVFNRTLTPAEVAAYAQGKPVPDMSSRWMSERPYVRLFNRNEKTARLVYTIYAPKAVKTVFSLKTGGIDAPERKINLEKGANLVFLPFDARRLACGKHKYEIVGRERAFFGKGAERFRTAGELEILPRFERGRFRILSWGGNNAKLPVDYIQSAGCDAKQEFSTAPARRLDDLQRRGMHIALNTNVAHKDDAVTSGFDLAEMRKRVEDDLKRNAGRANWDMTLTTTEATHPINMNKMKGVRRWEEWARQELGHAPVFDIVAQAQNIGWPRGHVRAADGVFEPDDVYRTFMWALRRGEPVQAVNHVITEAAHRLSPGNFTWSEAHNSGSTDATVVWDYTHNTRGLIPCFRMYSAFALDDGAKWQPTIGMGTWPDTYGWIGGRKPPDEKTAAATRFSLMLTSDEVKMQSFVVLACARSENLAYFDIDAWYDGEPHTAEPKPHTRVADPGSPARLKKAVDGQIRPFGILLRDMDMATSGGVALMQPKSGWHSCSLGWKRDMVSRVWSALMKELPSVDILRDGVTADMCAKYDHIVFPGARNILKSNDDALAAAAAKGTVIWTDFLCTRKYPGGRRFDNAPDDGMKNLNAVYGKYAATYTNVTALARSWRNLVRGKSFAWVESCDGEAVAFSRSCDGETRYAAVCNLTGTKGPLNRFTDRPDFLPYGKAAKALVSLRIPEHWTVYDFMTSRRLDAVKKENGRVYFELALPAAGCALLAAYPAKIVRLDARMRIPGNAPEGSVALTLTDADGKRPRGRQLVYATVTDADGKLRDESGWYTLKDGKGEIALYFPDCDTVRSVKVSVREKTTGLEARAD